MDEPLETSKNKIVIKKAEKGNLLNDSTPSPEGPSDIFQKPGWIDVWPQILCSFIALSSVVQPGINLAFSGILIPQLENDPNIKNFTKEQASWIASLVAISQPVGALFVGPLMDYIGRKKTCIFTNIPIITGWVIIYFTTTSLWPIYIARILMGFGAGMTTVGLVYVAEISHVQFRPMLLSLNSVNVAFGILITTVLGVYLEWHMAAFYFGLLSVASLVLSFFIPESPYWLVNFSDAPVETTKESVQYLNRRSWLFSEEWERLQEIKSSKISHSEENKTTFDKILDKFKQFGERGCYLPLILLLVIFFLQQSSGTYVVIFYTINIFMSIGGDFGFGLNKYNATIILGVLRFLMSIVSAILSKKIGRKPIMIVSCLMMALSAITTGVCLKVNNIDTINFGKENSTTVTPIEPKIDNVWILISLLAFVCAGSIGQMVIPWTLMSELLPTKIRASGSGLIVSYSSLLLFVVIKTFPGVLDYVSLPYVFFSYAVMSLFSTAFVIFFLPETFRKSLVQIANFFSKERTSIN